MCDDSSMSRTRSYTKAASMLRQFHDTLATTIESLQNFLDDNLHFFETESGQDAVSMSYLEIVHCETFHLRRFRRRLLQRMQRFDGMKDGVRWSRSLYWRSIRLTLTQASELICPPRESAVDQTGRRHRRSHQYDCGTTTASSQRFELSLCLTSSRHIYPSTSPQ